MAFNLTLTVHILFGTLGVFFFWRALLARKGSAPHRAAGKRFFIILLMVAASVGPVLFLRPLPFDPGHVVQFAYLALCLVTVTTIGWTAIRWKADPERFRGRHFKILGPVLALLGTLVLAAGLAKGDPVAAVLSWVGLAYGSAMMRFAWMRKPLHPLWWLNWHLNAVCGLFTAVHGTLLFVLWRWAAAPDASRMVTASFHIGVLVVAIALRLAYGRQRGVPLRFAASPTGTPLRQTSASSVQNPVSELHAKQVDKNGLRLPPV